MTDEFITHNSDKPPELAPAVLVEISTDGSLEFAFRYNPILRVDKIDWSSFALQYRALRNPDGHPYVSAEGLEPWARWVTTNEDGVPRQFEAKPYWHPIIGWACELRECFAAECHQHRHPGDWRDSLCEVWSEDHDE